MQTNDAGPSGDAMSDKVIYSQPAPAARFAAFRQGTEMIRNQRIRRAVAAIMIVLGAILMFLAAEPWPGALLFVLGILLELAGIALERKAK